MGQQIHKPVHIQTELWPPSFLPRQPGRLKYGDRTRGAGRHQTREASSGRGRAGARGVDTAEPAGTLRAAGTAWDHSFPLSRFTMILRWKLTRL